MTKVTYKENYNIITKSYPHALDIYKDDVFEETILFISGTAKDRYIDKLRKNYSATNR